MVFQNARGVEVQAPVLRFSRDAAVFQLCDLETVVHASELLNPFKIASQEGLLYSGQALVRNLVSTGLGDVCEASLNDSGFVFGSLTQDRLRSECSSFLQHWQRFYAIAPEYKVAVADLQTFLAALRLWCEKLEFAVSPTSAPPEQREKLQRTLAEEVQEQSLQLLGNLFERYELVAKKVPGDLHACYDEYAKRQIHPLLLSSPFVFRTYRKPLGYAGDYEVVNMMFRDPGEGGSTFAKLVNIYALGLPPIVGHRERIAYLARRLQEETLRAMRAGRRARIFNLGCGPAQEIQVFLRDSVVADHAELTLVDFNEPTLQYAGKVLEELRQRHRRATTIKLSRKSVQQLLKERARLGNAAPESAYDFVYCAGLFDYLTDKVCCQLIALLHGMLAPGGSLLVTNVDEHPARGQMECFLEWHLVYRNSRQLQALVPEEMVNDSLSILGDSGAGVNVFLELRKLERRGMAGIADAK